MLRISIMFFIVLSLLVFHTYGADIVELTPVRDEGEPYYFLMFQEGKEVHQVDNPVKFSVFTNNKILPDEDGIWLKTHCREIKGIKSVDLITNAESEKDQVILDTLFIKSCAFNDIQRSIFIQPSPSPGQEAYIFIDTKGKCYQRKYQYTKLQLTATVNRFKVETITCPEAVNKELKGATGTVESWSPNGLALQTFYWDKPISEEAAKIESVNFQGGQGYTLVCRTDSIKDSILVSKDPDDISEVIDKTPEDDDEITQEGEENKVEDHEKTLVTATVEYNGVALDRVKLKPGTCTVDNISPKTVSADEGIHVITFKTSKGEQKREYKLREKLAPSYKVVYLTRRIIGD